MLGTFSIAYQPRALQSLLFSSAFASLRGTGNRTMGTRWRARRVRERAGSGPRGGRPGESKTDVVVPVIGIVPVAVRRTEPPRFVVPGTAAKHTISIRPCSQG